MALYHSSVAFLDSFALLTKCDTSAINADIPARIQPNTGMDLIAAPTMRNAPASPMFATVPAVADAVCTACAAAAPVDAPTLAVLAVLLACSAAAFAVVAAVDAMVAVVSAAVDAVDATQKAHIEAVADLLRNEVNVKEVNFIEGQGILVKKVKCNFRVMGKKFGKLMKGVAAQMSALDQDQIAAFEKAGSITLNVEGQEALVDVTDVEIISEDIPGWLVSNDGNLTVALEVELTPELKKEGMARELINRIQNIRKDSGLEITDRIRVTLAHNEETDAAVAAFADYIKGQVLADDIVVAANDGAPVEFDGFTLNITVEKN